MAVEVMRSPELESILDCWVADRHLSRRKLAFLQTIYNQTFPGMANPGTAAAHYCEALELPQGSTWTQAMATLLDHLDPLPLQERRLVDVTECLVDQGVVSREWAQDAYDKCL